MLFYLLHLFFYYIIFIHIIAEGQLIGQIIDANEQVNPKNNEKGMKRSNLMNSRQYTKHLKTSHPETSKTKEKLLYPDVARLMKQGNSELT